LTLDMLRIRTRVLRLASLPPFPSILLGMDEAYLNKPFCGIIFLPALTQKCLAGVSVMVLAWTEIGLKETVPEIVYRK